MVNIILTAGGSQTDNLIQFRSSAEAVLGYVDVAGLGKVAGLGVGATPLANQLVAHAGTAAAPSLAFTSTHADTGLYGPGDHIIGLSIAGTEVIRVDSSGNLRILNKTLMGASITDTSTILGFFEFTANGASASAAGSVWSDTVAHVPGFTFFRGGGTRTAPTAVTDTMLMGKIAWAGQYHTHVGDYNTGAKFEAVAAGAWTSSSMPCFIRLFTTPAASDTAVERMRWDSAGNVGIGAAPTFGATAVSVFAIKTGTPPAAHVDDEIQIFSVDSSDSAATLGLMLEQAVEDIGTFTASHKIKVKINGTEYWVQLDAV